MLVWGSVGHAQDEGGSGLAPATPPTQTETQPPTQTPAQPETETPAQTPAQTAVQPAPEAPVFQPEQGPTGVPTAPPGYGTQPAQPTYTPGVQPVPNLQLRQPQLDPATAARIDALMQEQRQIRVGGWIAMMAAGAATTAVSVLFAVAFADVERTDTGCDRCGNNTGTITFSAISVVTAATAVIGFMMFLRRAKARRELTREIRQLRMNAMQRQVALLEF